jgi:hypothetical protein
MMCSSWMVSEREREKKIIVGGFLLLQYKIYCRTTTANGIALNYFFLLAIRVYKSSFSAITLFTHTPVLLF